MTVIKTCPPFSGVAARRSIPVVMSDTEELSEVATAIFCTNAGDVAVTLVDEFDPDGKTKVILSNVPAGTFISGLAIRQLWNTDTSNEAYEFRLFA
jgi:hypothetical protein